MKTIYKYELELTDDPVIEMPFKANVLSVGVQGNKIVVWAEVDTALSKQPRQFYIRGTGHPLDGTEKRFLGTVLYAGGLVWHVYEGKYEV